MNKTFKMVGGLKPSRSLFNNSHTVLFDCDMGELIPVLGMEMLPGQSTKVSIEEVIRMQPLVAPILHEINAYVHFFFVPTRLLMSDKDHGWETFLTGGVSGEESVSLPLWLDDKGNNNIVNLTLASKYSLADYFDIPVGVNIPVADQPLGFLQRAYNFIFNEYYIDRNYMPEVSLSNNNILHRCWEKDYFTSSLPSQQRGTAPALPISGILPVNFTGGDNLFKYDFEGVEKSQIGYTQGYPYLRSLGLTTPSSENGFALYGEVRQENDTSVNGRTGYVTASVNLNNAATFNVADLRLAFQIQKYLERNMRAGSRYIEFLKAHFGVSPTDTRMQRPEYVGGCKSAVVISEVMQTSATSDVSPQGNLAGKGLTADYNKITRFTAPEFGYLVGIMSIMPRAMYSQGLDRKFSRKSRYDWPMPEFTHLSEQAILNKEIYLSDNTTQNNGVFGYTGIFNEIRSSQSHVRGGMRDTLSYWHLGRKFSSLPVMNGQFLEVDPLADGLKRAFAVQDEKGFIVYLGFNIRNTIPLPAIAEPGLVDHF